MAAKTKTITFSYPHWDQSENDDGLLPFQHPQIYRVEKVTNSTEFWPNKQLSKTQVDELCEAKDWQVTVVPVRS